MALTKAGINFLAQAAIGQGIPFSNDNAHLAVGNSNTAFRAEQVGLQGDNQFRKKMDDSYPIIDAPKVSFKSTYGPDEANFPWNEWGLFNAATGGVMLCRNVESNGTKQSNQTWVLEVEITFDIGS